VAPLQRGREAVLNFGFALKDSVMDVGEILEAACGFLEAAVDQTSKAPPRYVGLWNWLWDGILEADCGEDGQAGTGSGTKSGKEFSRLAAERMDKLERALELDLGRNSRGCLRRGWIGWNWLWSCIWEGILEAAY
jgi:hypothetical protein